MEDPLETRATYKRMCLRDGKNWIENSEERCLMVNEHLPFVYSTNSGMPISSYEPLMSTTMALFLLYFQIKFQHHKPQRNWKGDNSFSSFPKFLPRQYPKISLFHDKLCFWGSWKYSFREIWNSPIREFH